MTLRLHLLGPFEATFNDAPLTSLRSAKGRGLLAYLASRPGHPHSREALATLFWGEVEEEAARLSLRVALSDLRKVLIPVRAVSNAPPLLVTSRQTIELRLPPNAGWVDAVEFDALWDACTAHGHTTLVRCPTCIQRLNQAVALYRGDFLADVILADSPGFDEWRRLQQEHYHKKTTAALTWMTDHHLTLGNYDQAQDYARRQLELEPWREEAHRQLMQALAASGQRSAALAQYEVCRRTLENELQAAPTAETSALHEQIRSGTLSDAMPVGLTPSVDLPAALTPFVGRTTELERIGEIVLDPACRLLTLLGPGGIGKTRLATHAVERFTRHFPNGAAFVSLDFYAVPDRMATAILHALHLAPTRDGTALLPQLISYLHDKDMLLVLDDCAPSPAMAAWIVELLRSTRHIKILAIARQRLNVRGEWILRVEGLSYPPPGPTSTLPVDTPLDTVVQQYSAVQLFVESVRRLAPAYRVDQSCLPHVVRICQLVQGMPLAIELAAAWTPVLSCHQIAQEIKDNFDILATSAADVPLRQRSLRAVFDQVWVLLSGTEQRALARLAVFRGNFDRTAGEAVAGASLPILASLTDKSLLSRVAVGDNDTEAQYSLHAVLRQYALQHLSDFSGEPDTTINRHGHYFMDFITQQTAAFPRAQQQSAIAQVALHIEDIRMAWEWACKRHDVIALRQAWPGLFAFYASRGWLRAGETAFGDLVAILRDGPHADIETGPPNVYQLLLGLALSSQAWFVFQMGRLGHADTLSRTGLAVLRKQDVPDALAFGLIIRASFAMHIGSDAEARECSEQSLQIWQATDNRYGIAMSFGVLGQLALRRGDRVAAEAHSLASLQLTRHLDNPWAIAFPLTSLDHAAHSIGDYPNMHELLQETLLTDQNRTNMPAIGLAYLHLGDLARARGDYDTAQRRYVQVLELFARHDFRYRVWQVVGDLATMLAENGQDDKALRLLILLRSETVTGPNQSQILSLYSSLAGRLPPDRVMSVAEDVRETTLDAEVANIIRSCSADNTLKGSESAIQ